MNITLYTKPYGGQTEVKLEAHLQVIRPYVGQNVLTGDEWIEDSVTLVVNTGTFWPVIIKLNEKEANKLADVLQKAAKHKHEHREQFIEEIKE